MGASVALAAASADGGSQIDLPPGWRRSEGAQSPADSLLGAPPSLARLWHVGTRSGVSRDRALRARMASSLSNSHCPACFLHRTIEYGPGAGGGAPPSRFRKLFQVRALLKPLTVGGRKLHVHVQRSAGRSSLCLLVAALLFSCAAGASCAVLKAQSASGSRFRSKNGGWGTCALGAGARGV